MSIQNNFYINAKDTKTNNKIHHPRPAKVDENKKKLDLFIKKLRNQSTALNNLANKHIFNLSLEQPYEQLFKKLEMLVNNKTVVFQNDGTVQYSLKNLPFDQGDVISQILKLDEHQTLKNFNSKFDGLCELVCNHMLINNLLGKGQDVNALKNIITPTILNKKEIKKSHLLHIFNFLQRLIAFLFGYYPDNIFKYSDQKRLLQKDGNERKVNRDILKKGLNGINDGETLKLEVFRKKGLSFYGHSLLIKKVGENYTYFDPNKGETRNLDFDELCNIIDSQIATWKGTDIFLMKGSQYLKRLERKKVIDIAKNSGIIQNT